MMKEDEEKNYYSCIGQRANRVNDLRREVNSLIYNWLMTGAVAGKVSSEVNCLMDEVEKIKGKVMHKRKE